MKTKHLLSLLGTLLFCHFLPRANAQGTAFTYQGRLNVGGASAGGSYDFRFRLAADPLGNTYVGNPFLTNAVPVTGGLFTTTIDFGTGIWTGSNYWVEVSVRTNGTGSYTVLSPLQAVTPTPYSVFAGTAGNMSGTLSATQLSGTVSVSQLPSVVVTNGASGVNISGTFSGNGAGVTNISYNSLTGSVTNGVPVGWGDNSYGEINIPSGLTNVKTAAVGGDFTLAVTGDGTVVAWGYNSNGQTNVPAGLSNVIGVAAGGYHSMALKSDGTVVAWGDNTYGQTTVPAGLSNVISVAAGNYHSLALKSDGTVTAWGLNIAGETSVPAGLSNVVAVAAGSDHNLALKNDGTVVAWGSDKYGQANVPAGLNNVIAVSAGGNHGMALKNDGTVVVWGDDTYGERNVPTGLSNVIAVAAGAVHSVALKNDGTVVAWGDDSQGELDLPIGLNHVIALAGGGLATHCLAIEQQVSSPVALLGSDNTFNGNIQALNLEVSNSISIGGSLRLNDQPMYLRSGSDVNHGLAYAGNGKTNFGPNILPDGPVLWGYGGGVLGTTFAGRAESLSWDSTGVTVYGVLKANGSGLSNLNWSALGGVLSAGGSGTSLSVTAGQLNGVASANSVTLDIPGVNNNLGVWDNLVVSGNITGSALNGSSAAINTSNPGGASLYVTGNRSGTWTGSTTWLVNTNSSSAAPALRVVNTSGSATNTDGALSVSIQGQGLIAEFGNASAFVVTITNDGTIYSKGLALTSDRNAKENFTPLDSKAVLEKVSAMPVTEWNYKDDPSDKKHIGPVAQDFQSAFGLNGGDEKHISVVDEAGVALAAIQGLHQELAELRAENAQLKARLEALENAKPRQR